MPSTSEKQRRAMRAAAAGKSTIGIPQSVGREFVSADKAITGARSTVHRTVHRQKHKDKYGTGTLKNA